MTDGVNTTLAALAIVAQVAAAGIAIALIVGALSPRFQAVFAGQWTTLSRQAVWLAWFTAAVATGGSLFFSQVAHFPPCQYCWYQRICMYPLSMILLVGALLKDRRAVLYAAVFPIVGACISIYHIYIEVNPDKESASCKAGIPCSTRWIDDFGYVTIPVMALSAFALIAVLLVVAWVAGGKGETEDRAAGS
jgi:disulfide bond formation protein DsbB